jgi:hypothetical protein
VSGSGGGTAVNTKQPTGNSCFEKWQGTMTLGQRATDFIFEFCSPKVPYPLLYALK